MKTMLTLSTRALGVSCLGALSLMAGCFGHRPGGNMSSNDFFTYESTPNMPMSVTLMDTRDESELWSVDVPVGQKLVLNFLPDKAKLADVDTPDLMRWEIYPAIHSTSTLRKAMPVPPAAARRLDLALREAPEYPAEPNPTIMVSPVAARRGGPVMPTNSSGSSQGRSGTYVRDGDDPYRSVVMPGQTGTNRDGAYYSSVDTDD